jgi:hypothetical protein
VLCTPSFSLLFVYACSKSQTASSQISHRTFTAHRLLETAAENFGCSHGSELAFRRRVHEELATIEARMRNLLPKEPSPKTARTQLEHKLQGVHLALTQYAVNIAY